VAPAGPHALLQVRHRSALQYPPDGHAAAALHARHPPERSTHVCTCVPAQRVAPGQPHSSSQPVHSLPLHDVPEGHGAGAAHERHPSSSARHACTKVPEHRTAPAVLQGFWHPSQRPPTVQLRRHTPEVGVRAMQRWPAGHAAGCDGTHEAAPGGSPPPGARHSYAPNPDTSLHSPPDGQFPATVAPAQCSPAGHASMGPQPRHPRPSAMQFCTCVP